MTEQTPQTPSEQAPEPVVIQFWALFDVDGFPLAFWRSDTNPTVPKGVWEITREQYMEWFDGGTRDPMEYKRFVNGQILTDKTRVRSVVDPERAAEAQFLPKLAAWVATVPGAPPELVALAARIGAKGS